MLYMVKMVAIRPLTGDGYSVSEGEVFTTTNKNAERLEAKGRAYRYFERKVVLPPENKALTPPDNKTVWPVAVVPFPVPQESVSSRRRRSH
jgi:hypothetical protein